MAETIAVMSAFKPDSRIIPNIDIAARQVRTLIVVDDSGTDNGEFWRGKNLPSNVVVRVNSTNQGIAAAINRGINEALASGSQYVLTLDQDTPIAPNLVGQLTAALHEPKAKYDRFRAAAPATVNGNPYGFSHDHAGKRCSIEVLQSGLLLSSSLIEQIGLFREDLFIDGVEVDFTIRMHAAGVHVLLVDGIDLTQNLGDPTVVRVLGRTIPTNNHPAFRRYYITRNRLVLFRDYGRAEPAWAKMAAIRLFKQSVVALFEEGRGQKLSAMLTGAAHALRRRMGKR